MKEVGPLQLHGGHLSLGGRKLGFGLRDVEVGGDAAFAAVLRQFERAAVSDRGFLQQLVSGIERAKSEVVNGDLGLEGQLGGLEVGGGGGQARARAFDLAAHTAPKIDLPARVERDDEGVVGRAPAGAASAGGLVCAGALAGDGGHSGDLGKVIRASEAHEGAGLLEVRKGGRKLLVVRGREAFEAVQLGIAEKFPPRAAG